MRVVLNGGKFGGLHTEAPDVACTLAVQGSAVTHLYRHDGLVEPSPEEMEAREDAYDALVAQAAARGDEVAPERHAPPLPQAVFIGLVTKAPNDAVTITPE